jgi:hypothetical protein
VITSPHLDLGQLCSLASYRAATVRRCSPRREGRPGRAIGSLRVFARGIRILSRLPQSAAAPEGASGFGSRLQRCRKLPCRLAELGAMLLVERIARGQRSRELREDFRQKTVMEMDHGLTPILARSHQLDGDAVRVGIGLELRVPTKKCPYKPCRGNRQRPRPCWQSDAVTFLGSLDRGAKFRQTGKPGPASYGPRPGEPPGCFRRRQRVPAFPVRRNMTTINGRRRPLR